MSSPRPSLSLLRAVADRNGYPIETFREDGIQGVIFSDVFDLEEDFLGSCWAFRGASDAEAAAILRFWLRQETRKTKTLEFGYSLACSLGRLLAEKGRLVEDLLDPVLRQTDWTSCDAPQFLLAGLAAFPDGPARAADLLDVVPEDARHGLFLACWLLPALPVQRKLLAKCLEWIADPRLARLPGRSLLAPLLPLQMARARHILPPPPRPPRPMDRPPRISRFDPMIPAPRPSPTSGGAASSRVFPPPLGPRVARPRFFPPHPPACAF